jgi:hypothetical protein
MPERRKSKRRSISYYMRIIDTGANQMIGHLADITLQGLRIDSQKPIPINKEYHLRIYTTSDVSDMDYINFSASARWCIPDPLEPGLYNVGFEIVGIDHHAAEIVQRIVEKYSAREYGDNF